MKCGKGKVEEVKCRGEICDIWPQEILAMELDLYIL